MLVPLQLLSLIWLLQPVTAQDSRPFDPQNHFIWPPAAGANAADQPNLAVYDDNPTLQAGVAPSRPFSWVSNLTNLKIVMWQQERPDRTVTHDLQGCEFNDNYNSGLSTSLYWNGSIGDIDLELSNIVFLAVYDCPEEGYPTFYSHYFNLTQVSALDISSPSPSPIYPVPTTTETLAFPSRTSTTYSSTSSSKTTVADDSKAPTPTSPTNQNENQESSSQSYENDAAAITAGSIGGGIGSALLLIASAFVFWRVRENKKRKKEEEISAAATARNLFHENQAVPVVPWNRPQLILAEKDGFVLAEKDGCRSPAELA